MNFGAPSTKGMKRNVAEKNVLLFEMKVVGAWGMLLLQSFFFSAKSQNIGSFSKLKTDVPAYSKK